LGFLKGRIEFICHNAFKSEMKYFGKTSFGYPIEINRLFAESDLKVILGTVLPHPFAGFSGGVKWFQ
jgi:nickel-dependent lactate racemase